MSFRRQWRKPWQNVGETLGCVTTVITVPFIASCLVTCHRLDFTGFSQSSRPLGRAAEEQGSSLTFWDLEPAGNNKVCEILKLKTRIQQRFFLFLVFSKTPETEVLNKIKEPPSTPGENRPTPAVTGWANGRLSGTATGCDGSSWPVQRWRDRLDDDARSCARDREFPRCLAVCRESVFCLFFPLVSACCSKIAARDSSSEFVVLSSSCWFLSGFWDSRETHPSSSCRAFLSDPISANRPHSTHPHKHSFYELSKSWKKNCFWAFSELGPPWSTRCSLGCSLY